MTDRKRHLAELDRLEPPDLWEQIERRHPRAELPDTPSRSRKTTVLVLASLLTIGSVALVVRAFGPSSSRTGSASESPVPPGTISETAVLPAAWHLAVAYGSVWVTGGGGVDRVDPATGEVVATIDVPRADESDIAAGDGHIWVTAGGAIVGIDASTNQVDRRFEIETGIHTIAFANDRLYVGHSAEGNGTLDEIDPTTGAFGREILTGGPGLGESGILPTSDGAIWVGYSSPAVGGGLSSGLVRVSNDLSEAVTVAGVDRVFSLAEAGGHVWAVGTDVLYEVAVDGTLVATFPIPLAGKVASDGQHLWLLTNTGSTSDKVYLPDPNVPARIVEVDTTTGALIGDGVALPHDVPANLTVGEGRVWVSFYDAGVLNGVSTDGAPAPSDPVVTITEDGTTAQVPAAWTFVGQPTPNVTDPHTLFAAASFEIAAADPCTWLAALPPDGAVVWVEEWHDVQGLGGQVSQFPPKPAQISLGSGEPFAYDCGAAEEHHLPVFRFPFQQEGRYFWGFIALGSSALEATQASAEQVLTSFIATASPSP